MYHLRSTLKQSNPSARSMHMIDSMRARDYVIIDTPEGAWKSPDMLS
jgi:hypothetical protein